ncbi:hypothetical protein [Mycobacterium sp.]|uniref:hypothetical protein n=1 Tax=Mycobacterium sp. TaxID=1785 RepID=UPI002C467269|nr:hypothetical protein [Mycobacterium sp.]HKP41501.1 hypothetical protein [Mycobacterium sp.]
MVEQRGLVAGIEHLPQMGEKDNRVYGAMDGAIRRNMFRQVQQRWLEWQKLFLSRLKGGPPC